MSKEYRNPKLQWNASRPCLATSNFEIRASFVIGHWSFSPLSFPHTRHGVCQATRPETPGGGCSLSPGERVRVRGNDGSTATECRVSQGLIAARRSRNPIVILLL